MTALTLLLGLTIAGAPADEWELRLPTDFPVTRSLNVEVEIPALSSKATFIAELKLANSAASGLTGTIAWKQLMHDGYRVAEDQEFPAAFGVRGNVVTLESSFGTDLRVMAAPLLFVYPDSVLSIGGKYEFVCDSDKRPIKYFYEVLAVEDLDGVEAVRVKGVVSEAADYGMRSEGFYWLARDGRLIKLEIDVRRWPVVQTGTLLDVKIRAVNR